MAESFALIVTRKLRWQLAVRRKDDWRRNWKPREGAEENSVLKLLTQFSPCISACFFNFLIFVIATCSFFFELYLRRKNWWDVMIYIYIFVSGALKKRQDSLLRDLRSNNDKLKSEGSSRPPTFRPFSSQIWATDFFFLVVFATWISE